MDDEGASVRKGISIGEAFTEVVNGALKKLPEQAEIVGIQVTLAYVTPTMEPFTVEACGDTTARSGFPMYEMARLFALYSDRCWKAWQTPQNGRGGLFVDRSRPRRRPRR